MSKATGERVTNVLLEAGRPMRPEEIAEKLDADLRNVKCLMQWISKAKNWPVVKLESDKKGALYVHRNFLTPDMKVFKHKSSGVKRPRGISEAILRSLEESKHPLSASQLAKITGYDAMQCSTCLSTLRRDGKVVLVETTRPFKYEINRTPGYEGLIASLEEVIKGVKQMGEEIESMREILDRIQEVTHGSR